MIISEQEKEQVQRIMSRLQKAYAEGLTSDTHEMKSLVEEINAASNAVALSVWTLSTKNACVSSAQASMYARWVHEYLVDAVLKAYQVPRGMEGIGVEPQIPHCMKDEIPADSFKMKPQYADAGMNNRQPRKPYDGQ